MKYRRSAKCIQIHVPRGSFHIHAQARTHTRTRARAHTHTHIHTHTYTRTHTHEHTHMRSCIHTHTLSLSLSRARARSLAVSPLLSRSLSLLPLHSLPLSLPSHTPPSAVKTCRCFFHTVNMSHIVLISIERSVLTRYRVPECSCQYINPAGKDVSLQLRLLIIQGCNSTRGHVICCRFRPRLAEIASWLERRTRDRKVASSNPGRSGGRIGFSRVNFVY